MTCFAGPGEGILDRNKTTELVNTFYNLVTDIYEWGWGQSFHFSPLLPGKNAAQSEAAHEARLAALLRLQVELQATSCAAACLCFCCRRHVRWGAPLAAALILGHETACNSAKAPMALLAVS